MGRQPNFWHGASHFNTHALISVNTTTYHPVSGLFKSGLKWGGTCLAISQGCQAILPQTETVRHPCLSGGVWPFRNTGDAAVLLHIRVTRQHAVAGRGGHFHRRPFTRAAHVEILWCEGRIRAFAEPLRVQGESNAEKKGKPNESKSFWWSYPKFWDRLKGISSEFLVAEAWH